MYNDSVNMKLFIKEFYSMVMDGSRNVSFTRDKHSAHRVKFH